jgi:hypothetical protein
LSLYAYVSKADFRAQLAALLGDPGMVRWVSGELDLYIAEALRTFGSLSGYWKDRAVFDITPPLYQYGNPNPIWWASFYDLYAMMPSLLGPTLKDQDLVKQIQYHLLEPATGTSWTGTDMFTLDDLTKALERRRNQFLVETGCILTETFLSVSAVPVSRVVLPDNVIDVRRLAWRDVLLNFSPMTASDEETANSYRNLWNLTPGTPSSYSIAVTPPLEIQLIPPPRDIGRIEMLSVNSGLPLNPATGVLLGIPDDLAWVVKWGAMADLLRKEGPAFDSVRADYCEQRYRFGVQVANVMPTVLSAYVNDKAIAIDCLANLDSFFRTWQNTFGYVKFMAMAGQNMLAFAPIDNYGSSAQLDVVRKAPIPVLDSDFVQLGREEYDAVLGYAHHLAEWKQGTYEIKSTLSGWQNLVKLASLKNRRLAASAKLLKVMLGRAEDEERVRPRATIEEETVATGTNGLQA